MVKRKNLENLDRPQQDRILDLVKRHGGMKRIAQLRLVCTAWRDCVTQYPGAIASAHTVSALRKACSMMPNMSSINIRAVVYEDIDLSPLSACPFLANMRVSICKNSAPRHTMRLDLGCLSTSLRSIHLHGVCFTASTFEEMPPVKAARITELCCSLWNDESRAVWGWLEYMPNLQVLHAGQTHFKGPTVYDEMFHRGIGRLSSLTSLTLTDGKLCNAVSSQLNCPSTIKDMQLNDMAIHQPWMTSAFNFLPNMTSLLLQNSTTEGNYPGQWGGLSPISSLRKFSSKNSTLAFLALAPKTLQSLDLHVGQLPPRHSLQSYIWRVGGLTQLTHLELCDVYGPISSQLKRLRTLPQLLELRLLYCQNTPFQVFTPGSFPSLRSLYLEDDLFSVQASKDAGEGGGSSRESFDRELAECSRAIFNLPNLVQASGYSALLEAATMEALMTWSFSVLESGVKKAGFDYFYQAVRRF